MLERVRPLPASALVLALLAPQALCSPLPVRDQNPLLAGFDLPAALPARIPEGGAWTLDASFAWGNSAVVQANPHEMLVVDAETRELRIALSRPLGHGYALKLDLPLRQTSGGTLDSFIDGWHDFFGMPEGARPKLPRDSLRIEYERDGRRLVDAHASRSGIGDVSLRLGKQLGRAPVAAWLAIKLPTGDAGDLTGSGSVDATAALAFERALGDDYAVFAQVAGTWLGEGDRMSAQQRNFAWSGSAGLSAGVFRDLSLIVQLDAHTAVFDSDERFLGEAVMLTVGGSYRISNWDLSFAVTEDISVDSAPDVVFLFQIKRRAR